MDCEGLLALVNLGDLKRIPLSIVYDYRCLVCGHEVVRDVPFERDLN